MVHAGDVGLELPAQGPARQGHQGLEAPEEQGDDHPLPPADPPHGQPLADSGREGVHAQSHADEKQLPIAHTRVSFYPLSSYPSPNEKSQTPRV